MKYSRTIIAVFVTALLSYTSAQAQQFKRIDDLQYYDAPDATDKHFLDLYLPETPAPAPMLLWIHGGAWAFGNRKNEKQLAEKFAKAGIAVAVMSYRLSPGTWVDPKYDTGIQHPEHIKDVARAFAWLHRNAAEYGYSQSQLFVSGYSAGGHLSALLAADGRYLESMGLSTEQIRGIVPIAGTYDISDYHDAHLRANGPDMAERHVKAVFGQTEEDFNHASPISYINNINCPVLLISENQTYDYTMLFEDALKASKIANVRSLHVSELDHRGLFVNLAQAEKSNYREQIVTFIRNGVQKTGDSEMIFSGSMRRTK